MEDDEKRQTKIEKLGIKFIRFQDSNVRNNIESVVKAIELWIDNETTP